MYAYNPRWYRYARYAGAWRVIILVFNKVHIFGIESALNLWFLLYFAARFVRRTTKWSANQNNIHINTHNTEEYWASKLNDRLFTRYWMRMAPDNRSRRCWENINKKCCFSFQQNWIEFLQLEYGWASVFELCYIVLSRSTAFLRHSLHSIDQ